MIKTIASVILCLFAGLLPAQDAPQIKKPIIGVSCSHTGNTSSSAGKTYTETILKAGGLPILIPVMEDDEAIDEILSLVDALILTGGEDIHPAYFNEDPIPELGSVNDARDIYDLALIRLASERRIPLLGICRGEQLINVAFGGTLYQDIPAQYEDTTVNHHQVISAKYPTHYVELLLGSWIENVTGETELVTNTHHHQAVKDVAPGFRVSAWSCDGIPEAIEATDGRPVWGVQFHPEGQALYDDPVMSSFFRFIINEAISYRSDKTSAK